MNFPNPLTGGTSTRRGKVLSPCKSNENGYFRVYIEGRRVAVHRLVATAFHGPQPVGKPIIRHLDGNPDNNSESNLQWGTHSENEEDKLRHGRNYYRNKTHCPKGHEYTEKNTRITKTPTGYGRFCRECSRLFNEERRQRGLPEGDPRHGTANGHLTYGCKCGPCKKASDEYCSPESRAERKSRK